MVVKIFAKSLYSSHFLFQLLLRRPHPALLNITTTYNLPQMPISWISDLLMVDSNSSDLSCILCQGEVEDICHVLTECKGIAETREHILPEMLNGISRVNLYSMLLDLPSFNTRTPGHWLNSYLIVHPRTSTVNTDLVRETFKTRNRENLGKIPNLRWPFSKLGNFVKNFRKI